MTQFEASIPELDEYLDYWITELINTGMTLIPYDYIRLFNSAVDQLSIEFEFCAMDGGLMAFYLTSMSLPL